MAGPRRWQANIETQRYRHFEPLLQVNQRETSRVGQTTSSWGVGEMVAMARPSTTLAPNDGRTRTKCLRYLCHIVDEKYEALDVSLARLGGHIDLVLHSRGRPHIRLESTRRSNSCSVYFDPQTMCFPVQVVENASGCRQVVQVSTRELGLNHHSRRSPPVRQNNSAARTRSKTPSRDDYLELGANTQGHRVTDIGLRVHRRPPRPNLRRTTSASDACERSAPGQRARNRSPCPILRRR